MPTSQFLSQADVNIVFFVVTLSNLEKDPRKCGHFDLLSSAQLSYYSANMHEVAAIKNNKHLKTKNTGVLSIGEPLLWHQYVEYFYFRVACS